jgi:hypothetical protein
MRIEIIKAEPVAWYSEAIGKTMNAWKNPMMPGVYFVHTKLFVLGEDCLVIDGEEPKEETVEYTN